VQRVFPQSIEVQRELAIEHLAGSVSNAEEAGASLLRRCIE
jgi:hypothetical protein